MQGYLLINPNGNRTWYLRYRFPGKESHISFGAYPALPLRRLPELPENISLYRGRELTRLALQLNPHIFLRSSELRFARRALTG